MDESACFSQEDLALLNPTSVRIAGAFEMLPPTHQMSIIDIILSAVRRQHRIDNTFNLVQFALGQRIEQEQQVAA